MPNWTHHISRSLLLLLLLLPTMQSCDFFRRLAGRPDSAFIEAKRLRIEREEAEHQRRIDSVKQLRARISDSLALVESIRLRSNAVVEARQLDPASKNKLSARYYIIMGSFAKEHNAEAFAHKLKDEGHEPYLIRYKNGFTAVGICPSDRLEKVASDLEGLKGQSLVPEDVWVLNNE